MSSQTPLTAISTTFDKTSLPGRVKTLDEVLKAAGPTN